MTNYGCVRTCVRMHVRTCVVFRDPLLLMLYLVYLFLTYLTPVTYFAVKQWHEELTREPKKTFVPPWRESQWQWWKLWTTSQSTEAATRRDLCVGRLTLGKPNTHTYMCVHAWQHKWDAHSCAQRGSEASGGSEVSGKLRYRDSCDSRRYRDS